MLFNMTLKDFYSLLARLFLGYVFFSSGLCKLADGHFGQLIGPPNIIKAFEQYDLGLFGQFLAFSQVMIGALVLSQRWSLLGLVMLVPMNTSILAVTTSMHWQGTPYVNAFLLLINFLALMYEWKTLRFFLLPDISEQTLPSRTQQLFPRVGPAAGVVLLALAAALSAGFLHSLLMICGVVALILAWINAWRPDESWLVKTALGASLFAVVSLALSEPLSEWNINAYVLLGGGILLTALATGIFTLLRWFSKSPQIG